MGKIFTFFDIETTGLDKSADDILSFGFVRLDEKYNILQQGTLYFYKPEFKIEKAQHVHHLTREFLSQFEDEFENNLAMMWAILHDSNVLGKNSKAFDMPFISNFISNYAPSLGAPVPKAHVDIQDYVKREFQEKFKTTKYGTLGQYKDMYKVTDEYIMSLISENGDANRLHTALFDAWVTAIVFIRYCKENNMSL